jgi:hypothetical protein
MMNVDFYLSDQNAINRLVTEWNQYKEKFVIAYDFDDTVFDYHNKGRVYSDVIELLRKCKEFGAHLVVFTANPDEKLPTIRDYLLDNSIPFDAINVTPDFIPIAVGTKKIYYNVFLDDRAGLSSSYYCLLEALETMKENELVRWNIGD